MVRSRAIAAAVFLTTLIAVGYATQKPDFSGTWVVVTPEASAGDEETIKQDATTIVFSHASGQGSHTFTYRLDGSESRNVVTPHPGEETVTVARAVWDGAVLVITEKIVHSAGRSVETKSRLWLDEKGQLVREVMETIDGKPQPPMKIVSRKKG